MSGILYPSQLKYLKQFKKNDDPLIEEMEEYAKEHKVPILSRPAVDFLEQIVMLTNPERVLEIGRSEEHTSELQSRENLVCRLLLEKKKNKRDIITNK